MFGPKRGDCAKMSPMRDVRYERRAGRTSIRLFNALARTLYRFKPSALYRFKPSMADLNEEALLATARKKTGFSDFGGESFRAALPRLLASIEANAQIHEFGRFL